MSNQPSPSTARAARASAQAIARSWWHPLQDEHGTLSGCADAIAAELQAEGRTLGKPARLTEAFYGLAWALGRAAWSSGRFTMVTDVARLLRRNLRNATGQVLTEADALNLAVEALADQRAEEREAS